MKKYLISLPSDLEILDLNNYVCPTFDLDNKSILNIYLESDSEQEFIDSFLNHIYCHLEHSNDNILKMAFSYINKDLLILNLCFLYDHITNHLLLNLGTSKNIHFLNYTNLKNRVLLEV